MVGPHVARVLIVSLTDERRARIDTQWGQMSGGGKYPAFARVAAARDGRVVPGRRSCDHSAGNGLKWLSDRRTDDSVLHTPPPMLRPPPRGLALL